MRLHQAICSVLTLLTLSGCGIPGYQLNKEERRADLEWIYGTVRVNYGPLELKQEKYGYDIDQEKTQCIAESDAIEMNEKTNDNFRALVMKCVSRLQDAHVSINQMGLMAPGKSKVAYLGFKTERAKYKNIDKLQDALRVTSLLKNEKNNLLPVKVGDYILAANEEPILDVLKKDLVPYRNVGNESASLTIAAKSFALRAGNTLPLPEADDIKLLVAHKDSLGEYSVKTIELPWIKKDLFTFLKENAPDQEAPPTPSANASAEEKAAMSVSHLFTQLLRAAPSPVKQMVKFLNIHPIDGEIVMDAPSLEKLHSVALDYNLNHSFAYVDMNPVIYATEPAESLENLKAERRIRETIAADLSTPESIQLVAYVVKEPVMKTLIGYIRIASFSVTAADVRVFSQMLQQMEELNVKGIVIDLIDNGGGSLLDGLQMAALLTDKPVEYPSLRFSLNTNWFQSFEGRVINGTSDIEKELAQRILNQMQEERGQGKRLSTPFSILNLYPFAREQLGELYRLNHNTKVVVVANEMCASMCDVFTQFVKDNQIGRLMGTKAMGAGGNVTMHGTSPSSLFMMNVTESLLMRKDSGYIENDGAEPDIEVDTVADRTNKFSSVLTRAFQKAAE